MDANLAPFIFPNTGQLRMRRQAAALCYRIERGAPKVLLITTRKSRRWIIPKGWLIDGLSPAQTACQEAWEEAGVRGVCLGQAAGRFWYQKNRSKKGPVICAVDVFPLQVQTVSAQFPEQHQRDRKWFSPEKAASKVKSDELAQLLRKLGRINH